jgi:hypothetical protein
LFIPAAAPILATILLKVGVVAPAVLATNTLAPAVPLLALIKIALFQRLRLLEEAVRHNEAIVLPPVAHAVLVVIIPRVTLPAAVFTLFASVVRMLVRL